MSGECEYMGKRLSSSVYTFIGEWEYMGKRLSSSVYTFIGEWEYMGKRLSSSVFSWEYGYTFSIRVSGNTWVKDCHLQFIRS